MNVMDYTKCMHCSRYGKLADSMTNDTKLYTDCWLCEETESFIVSDYTPLQKFNNYFVYGLFSFLSGIVVLYCIRFMDLYSSGWWILTVKGSALIVLGGILSCNELIKVE